MTKMSPGAIAVGPLLAALIEGMAAAAAEQAPGAALGLAVRPGNQIAAGEFHPSCSPARA